METFLQGASVPASQLDTDSWAGSIHFGGGLRGAHSMSEAYENRLLLSDLPL
jgi:hypothetical protein